MASEIARRTRTSLNGGRSCASAMPNPIAAARPIEPIM